MKRKAFIGLILLSLCFILGGVYITAGMNRVVIKLQDIIFLQQMHYQRKALVLKIKELQTDLLLKDSPHAVNLDTFVKHGEDMATTLNDCFSCHHPVDPLAQKIYSLQRILEAYQGKLSRVYTLRANAQRLTAAKKNAYEAGKELQFAIMGLFHDADEKIIERTAQAQQSIFSTRWVFIMLVTFGPLIIILLASFFSDISPMGLRSSLKPSAK